MTERSERITDVVATDGLPSEDAWVANRVQAVRLFRLGLDELKAQLDPLRRPLAGRVLPERLVGLVQQPDGEPAPRLQLHLVPPAGRVTRFTTTDVNGHFVLALAPALAAPSTGAITLGVRGANQATTVSVPLDAVDDNGLVGVLKLPALLKPLPEGLLASLAAFARPEGGDAAPIAGTRPRVGADGERVYTASGAVERFPYAIFVRLVEPGLTAFTATTNVWADESKKRFFPTVGRDASAQESASTERESLSAYVDRIPLERPLDLDGLRRRIAGVGEDGAASAKEIVPLAGTLGLGYVVHLAQRWTPAGIALGELVHSLPLTPGERQTIAVVEAGQGEPLSSSQTDTDASTESVFASAFDEAARGGSLAAAAPWSRDGSAILAFSGGGATLSAPPWKKPAPIKHGVSPDQEPKTEASSLWFESHRDFASRAALDLRNAVERGAASSRRALGARIRPASAGEARARVIANPHRARMLTYQYWELQRLFDVATSVEGATLVCLVPLDLIRFLPTDQPMVLAGTGDLPDRPAVLARYARLLEHAGALAQSLPERHRRGLAQLEQLAADPSASFDPTGAVAEEIVSIAVRGTFLPFEEITATAVTRRGARIGPVRLGGTIEPIPADASDRAQAFSTREALLGYLRGRRADDTGFVLKGDLALPPDVARDEIVAFELARHARALDHDFVPSSIRLDPSTLEAELGGPLVWDLNARLRRPGATSGGDAYVAGYPAIASREQLPMGGLVIPAARLSSVLRYVQLREIEATLQHVVRSTLRYSQAVWRALSPEERALLLEGYTLGAPEKGIKSDAHNIPLLQCVENRVLGFQGNAMLLPFHVPRRVADELGMTSIEVEATLTEFHRTGLMAPAFSVALPARGMLGEAVLAPAAAADGSEPVQLWRWVDGDPDAAG